MSLINREFSVPPILSMRKHIKNWAFDKGYHLCMKFWAFFAFSKFPKVSFSHVIVFFVVLHYLNSYSRLDVAGTCQFILFSLYIKSSLNAFKCVIWEVRNCEMKKYSLVIIKKLVITFLGYFYFHLNYFLTLKCDTLFQAEYSH